jgi:hypothetical protein
MNNNNEDDDDSASDHLPKIDVKSKSANIASVASTSPKTKTDEKSKDEAAVAAVSPTTLRDNDEASATTDNKTTPTRTAHHPLVANVEIDAPNTAVLYRYYMPMMHASKTELEVAMRLPVSKYETWRNRLPQPVAHEVGAVVAAIEYASMHTPSHVSKCVFSIPSLRFTMCQSLGILYCDSCDRMLPFEQFDICHKCNLASWCRDCGLQHSVQQCLSHLSLKTKWLSPYLRGGPDKCLNCDRATGVGVKLMCCGKCRVAVYCDVKCQRADWKLHRPECAGVGRALLKPQGATNATNAAAAETDTFVIKTDASITPIQLNQQPLTKS